MQKLIATSLFLFCAVVVMHANTAEAETATTTTGTTTAEVTTDVDEHVSHLESLMAQIEVLKKKLAELMGQVGTVKAQLRADLAEGATGDDVAKLQALLATDPTLYPEGLKTGYFGPRTEEALKRFQLRHELEVTGVLDEETKALLEEYLAAAGNAGIPPGFLRAPGMQMKIEMRYREHCESSGHGKGAFCNKMKVKYEADDEDGDDSDEDSDDAIDGSDDATEAIDDAAAVIAALEDVIDASDEDAATIDDAEEALADAEAKLEAAQAKLAADDFDAAEDEAKDAEDIAKDAYEDLVGTSYDDASDDSDDEDMDEDDSDEDEDDSDSEDEDEDD
jgi:peptidoglycan hydrolase CwlO-like protein